MRSALKALFGLGDRLRHRRRHAAVRQRLASIGTPRRLLVLCTGNVCRSPYLEALLKRALPDIRIASAGLVGFDRPVPAAAMSAAASRGIDLSDFRSHALEAHRARSADAVVVMDERQARYLNAYAGIPRGRIIVAGDLDPIATYSRTITDPWQQSADVFESTFDRLDRCASTLIFHWRPDPVPEATPRQFSAKPATRAASIARVPQAQT